MTPPVITALYAGVLALILVGLAMRVIRIRRGKRIGIGDGNAVQHDVSGSDTCGRGLYATDLYCRLQILESRLDRLTVLDDLSGERSEIGRS